MRRVVLLLSLMALPLSSCGPDKQRICSGDDPAFEVVLKLSGRPLPADTVVHVTYAGSGKEDFRLADPCVRHEVTFCQAVDENGVALDVCAPDAVGAAGAAGDFADLGHDQVVTALVCDLWTAGFTELKVNGTGFATVEYDLAPKDDQCTVKSELLLDAADAGR